MRYSVTMKRIISSMVFTLAVCAALAAQTETKPDTPSKKPASVTEYEPIRKGDQNIRISLGPAFSLFNISPDGIVKETNMNIGATATIGFSRFITSRISLGGEIVFAFHPTLGENIFFYLPLMVNGTYEFVFNRIHVPVTLSMGGAFETYNGVSYFGPIIKPEVGVWYQLKPDWSFGVSTAMDVLSQFYQKSVNNRTGFFVEATAGFRYHF
jgi:hypothetical protein